MAKIFASCLLTFALSAAMPSHVFAQEGSSRQYGTLEGQNENRDYELVNESDHPVVKTLVTKQDSLLNKSNTKKVSIDQQKNSPKKGGDDEAPFNFLYYIIQRFKTSDIIED